MTTVPPPTPTEAELTPAEHEQLEDDNPAALVQFARSGLIRLPMRVEYDGDGKVTNVVRARLRRPFMGELKLLTLRLEDMADEMADERERVKVQADALEAEAAKVDESTGLEPEERVQLISKLRRDSRLVGRSLNDKAEQARMEWWGQAFDLLSYDGPLGEPEQAPPWLGDGLLPARALRHWRTVPLSPG